MQGLAQLQKSILNFQNYESIQAMKNALVVYEIKYNYKRRLVV